jgi:plastocyanin
VIRRASLLLVAATVAGVALARVASAASASARASAATRPPAAHLLVYAQEWSLWPSTTTLRAGTIDVELWNRGQDAHDLRIRRLNGAGQLTGPVAGAVRTTPSGKISHAVWHLSSGRYEIYCSLPGHMAMGMHARITIRRS